MSRIAALSLALTCALGSVCLAQDSQPTSQPTSKPVKKAVKKAVKLDPRVVLDAIGTLDKKAVVPNGLQYFLYERFNYFRFRIDSKHKIGQKKLDKFIGKMDRFWKKQDPENKQTADFSITIRQETKYDAAKFYGEAQAHNYKGKIKAELKDGNGTVLLTIEFGLSWGRLISSGLSKRQVQGRYDQMVHTAVALGLLNNSAIKDKILPKYKIALAKWSKKQKKTLLKVLEGSTETLKKGEMAKFVRGVKIDGATK
ncbi:MAG: hypothetical protein JKY65_29550 [Planctomycetes bacterium]|nr:hypothetical protein [Planctomycetota bacterium]